MKKINNKLLLLGLLFTIGFYSCEDKFLDEEQNYIIDSESYFNSEDDYYLALIGVYDLLASTWVNNLVGGIASDDSFSGGESPVDVPGMQQIDDMIHTPVNNDLKVIWDGMFAGIKRANYFLEFQNNIEFDDREIMVAEVRFLRAYYHFELVKWFGGIPIKEYQNALLGQGKRFAPGDETIVPRYSFSDVYALIESDLIYAVNTLNYTAPNIGRATKGAAQALLGKAYLFQDKFSEASNILVNLIDNGPYQLVQNQFEGGELSSIGYAKIFENGGENGPESVFEVQYTDGEGAGFSCLQCSEGNVAVGFMGIRNPSYFLDHPNFDEFTEPLPQNIIDQLDEILVNIGANPVGSGPLFDGGYSFNVPTQEAFDIYAEEDLRRDVSILDIQALSETIDPIPFVDDSNGTITGTPLDSYSIDYSWVNGHKHTGYYNKKYLARRGDQNIGDPNLTNPNNYRSIRYADVLLMAAEALNKQGIDPAAQSYLNLVRERAFGTTDYNITATGTELGDAIFEERRLELMGEGHRFFDLVRTGKAPQVIDGFVADKHEVFPIPFQEIQFSNGNWSQNPNY